MMVKHLLVLGCLLFPLVGFSQTRTNKPKPLNFQADKNKVQVLPQRFEYTLLDEDRLKIGDILIDTTQIIFQIEKRRGTYRIHFEWPADLIKEGQLALKDNSGKAIFNTVLTKSNVKLKPGKLQEDDTGLRFQIASLTVEDVPPELVEDIKVLPFMEFCIFRESEETRLYLCSKELYVSSQDKSMTVKARSATKKSSQIEINGKVVGNQGLIYLNDRSENVAFNAKTRTGAFLEIETRMKDVDFKDVVLSPDEDQIILTASGARPVDESKVKKISESDWQITLPRSRPVLFLNGDGDIPMRQEFFVRGPLPREKNRAFLSSRSLSRTYSSELSFTGIAPEDINVKVADGASKATIETLKKNQFLWTIRDIPKGKESRHYLQLSNKEQEFIAGYDVFRGEPYSLGLNTQYLTPAGVAYGTVDFHWWMENFLFVSSDWANFHWGIALERRQQLVEKDDFAKANFTTIELLWRAQDGYHLIDETWGLSFPLQNIDGEGLSLMTFGVGAYVEKKPGRWLKPFMKWSELRLQYFTGSSGGDVKLNSAFQIKGIGYWPMSSQWYLRYGLDFSQYKFSPSADEGSTQLGINAGVFWKF